MPASALPSHRLDAFQVGRKSPSPPGERIPRKPGAQGPRQRQIGRGRRTFRAVSDRAPQRLRPGARPRSRSTRRSGQVRGRSCASEAAIGPARLRVRRMMRARTRRSSRRCRPDRRFGQARRRRREPERRSQSAPHQPAGPFQHVHGRWTSERVSGDRRMQQSGGSVGDELESSIGDFRWSRQRGELRDGSSRLTGSPVHDRDGRVIPIPASPGWREALRETQRRAGDAVQGRDFGPGGRPAVVMGGCGFGG